MLFFLVNSASITPASFRQNGLRVSLDHANQRPHCLIKLEKVIALLQPKVHQVCLQLAACEHENTNETDRSVDERAQAKARQRVVKPITRDHEIARTGGTNRNQNRQQHRTEMKAAPVLSSATQTTSGGRMADQCRTVTCRLL